MLLENIEKLIRLQKVLSSNTQLSLEDIKELYLLQIDKVIHTNSKATALYLITEKLQQLRKALGIATSKETSYYFGQTVEKDIMCTHIATNADGSTIGYTIEPIFNEDIGIWEYDDDDPEHIKRFYTITGTKFLGDCSHSLQTYI